MKVTVLLFAKLRELLGQERLEIELTPETAASEVLPLLFKEKHQAQQIGHCLLFAINQNYVQPNTLLQDGDELALIPPVSGG